MYNIKMENTILDMEFDSDTDDSDYETEEEEEEDDELHNEYIDALLRVILLRLQLRTLLEVDQ